MSGFAYKRDYIPRGEDELRRYVDRQPHLNGLIATNADPYTKAFAREERILLARVGCSAYAAAGQHLLICASDVGGFNAVKPLIRAALDSDQVAYISLNLAGFAYTSFAGCELHNCFTRIEASGLTLAAKRSILFNLSVPPSSVVITPATYSGLEDSWLMSAKSIYGARHLVFVQDHWGSYSPSTAETVCQNADPVDLILCNDDSVARKIQGQQLLLRQLNIPLCKSRKCVML